METHHDGDDGRPRDDSIAGTGPGIPDDALAPGEDAMPEPPSDEEVARIAQKLGVATSPDAEEGR